MHFRRLLSTTAILNNNVSTNAKRQIENRMQAWQIHEYGDVNQLKQSNIRIPMIENPTQVLVKVTASSVNPIDIAMINGYGSKLFNCWRAIKKANAGLEFPLILGRDFSGVVVTKGFQVSEQLKIGDNVWGVVPVEQQGCHAQYVVVDQKHVGIKPENLSNIEAASILYAGLTAWSSLWITGDLCYKKGLLPHSSRQSVLILGGSGGVGTLAIQLAKSWDMYVVTTCSPDAVELLKSLGADVVINYKESDADSKLISEGKYHIILDCANQGIETIRQKKYPFSTYITLNSPLLKNIDNHGFLEGMVRNIGSLVNSNLSAITDKGGCVKWGFFVPSQTGIMTLKKLVENRQIVPVIEKVYDFEQLPEAYKRAMEGHSRGKIVIEMKDK